MRNPIERIIRPANSHMLWDDPPVMDPLVEPERARVPKWGWNVQQLAQSTSNGLPVDPITVQQVYDLTYATDEALALANQTVVGLVYLDRKLQTEAEEAEVDEYHRTQREGIDSCKEGLTPQGARDQMQEFAEACNCGVVGLCDECTMRENQGWDSVDWDTWMKQACKEVLAESKERVSDAWQVLCQRRHGIDNGVADSPSTREEREQEVDEFIDFVCEQTSLSYQVVKAQLIMAVSAFEVAALKDQAPESFSEPNWADARMRQRVQDKLDGTTEYRENWRRLCNIQYHAHCLDLGNDGHPENDCFLSPEEEQERQELITKIAHRERVSPAVVEYRTRQAAYAHGRDPGADGDPDRFLPPHPGSLRLDDDERKRGMGL